MSTVKSHLRFIAATVGTHIKMRKSYKILFAITALILCVFIYDRFIDDYRVIKENYLIKRNFKNNQEQFAKVYNAFKGFPDIDINFNTNNYIDLCILKGVRIDSMQSDDWYFSNPIPFLYITDTSAYFNYKDTVHIVHSYKEINDELTVETTFKTFHIDQGWQLNYYGYGKTKFITDIYKTANLDEKIVNTIKSELRKVNCFGYEKVNNGIILYYRTNPFFTDLYSYCILNNVEQVPKYIEKSFYHGKLDSNTYWFYYEKLPLVSYTPWLKLYNRDI